MEKLLENLKESIKHYEDCVDADIAEHIIFELTLNLYTSCGKVYRKCKVILNNKFGKMIDEKINEIISKK